MDVFSLDGRSSLPLTVEGFEKATGKVAPYFQMNSGRMSYYAKCPGCGNPISIVNLYTDRRMEADGSAMALHGRHVCHAVAGIGDYSEEDYLDCPYANPETFSGTGKRKPGSRESAVLQDLLCHHAEIILVRVREILGFYIGERFFEGMLDQFHAANGIHYRHVNRWNLPFSVINLNRSLNLRGQSLSKYGPLRDLQKEFPTKYFELSNKGVVTPRQQGSKAEFRVFLTGHSVQHPETVTIQFEEYSAPNQDRSKVFAQELEVDGDNGKFIRAVEAKERVLSMAQSIFQGRSQPQ